MNLTGRTSRWAVVALAFTLAALPASAQQRAEKGYEPVVGQAGKDVIWVPTPPELVERMLRMASTTPSDFVIDLGSGDGRIAIAAAKKFGARALGIEYNPEMVTLSNGTAQREGVADRVRFVKADIFESDFSQATVITMYLLPDLNLKLRPKILEMKPGTRVVSHQFTMGEWEPDETAVMESRSALFWIVPAKVGGAWRLRVGSQDAELTLRQSFQLLEGTLKWAGGSQEISDARMRGEAIRFRVKDTSGVREFAGRLVGASMEGTERSGASETRWQATRK